MDVTLASQEVSGTLPQPFGEVFTLEEAAAFLKIGYNNALDLVNSGRLKAVHPWPGARVWRIRKVWVEEYLEGLLEEAA